MISQLQSKDAPAPNKDAIYPPRLRRPISRLQFFLKRSGDAEQHLLRSPIGWQVSGEQAPGCEGARLLSIDDRADDLGSEPRKAYQLGEP